MRSLIGTGRLVLAVLALGIGSGCAPAGDEQVTTTDTVSGTEPGAPAVPQVPGAPEASATSPAAVAPPVSDAAAEAGPVYVDVRTPEEYQAGHVPGAILIPHDQVAARWQELAGLRDRQLVVYCRSGRRSGLAIEVLRAQGFTNLENGGGLEALAAARGLPIVTD